VNGPVCVAPPILLFHMPQCEELGGYTYKFITLVVKGSNLSIRNGWLSRAIAQQHPIRPSGEAQRERLNILIDR